ncbi:MAG: di-trans,poly-cis-decaprenylcistransferase [Clostridia bacterium]|nr:di-trans,poly-cis-decaprenylcistransferase [Clostridia bacterium]MDE7328651.1 di-trans,poly-cis-decaprenylcistransferase [Clostridia bacterium]
MEKALKIPKHIAFIMDGNGRWAAERNLSRSDGHKQGAEALKRVIKACSDRGIEVVSVYAFSCENWSRPQSEIKFLFSLITQFAKKELKQYAESGYRITFSGDLTQLPKSTQNTIKKVMDLSRNNKGILVNVALNYGSRQEITRAVNRILQSGLREIDEQMLEDCLYTAGLPPLDLLVRSSGEKRLSNFMLWQCAYSELIFIDKYWPDFDEDTLTQLLEEYSRRDRRFGGVK